MSRGLGDVYKRQLWFGSKEVIPNSTLSLGELPKTIESNEGVIFYSEQITTKSATLETLIKLKELGVDSNRILLISAICSNKGLNEIAKIFPNQVIYTSCIDEEDERTQLLVPGIGNPLSRLSTCLLYTSPSPRDISGSRMPSSA